MRVVSILVLVALGLMTVISFGVESQSIGQRFHRETSYGDEGLKGESPVMGKQIPLYKTYENATKVKLPEPVQSNVPLEDAIQKRRSVRSFSDRSISLGQLARLLLSADGITRTSSGYELRSAPSGGALYPIDIYIIASNVEGLEAGLYHFQVSDSSLELVEAGDLREGIHSASNDQGSVGSSPLTMVLTSRFDRITAKYFDRGYRYAYIEAGSICQNIYLLATSLGMGTVAVGAFNDDALNRLLGIDGVDEAGLLIMPVGFPTGR